MFDYINFGKNKENFFSYYPSYPRDNPKNNWFKKKPMKDYNNNDKWLFIKYEYPLYGSKIYYDSFYDSYYSIDQNNMKIYDPNNYAWKYFNDEDKRKYYSVWRHNYPITKLTPRYCYGEKCTPYETTDRSFGHKNHIFNIPGKHHLIKKENY